MGDSAEIAELRALYLEEKARRVAAEKLLQNRELMWEEERDELTARAMTLEAQEKEPEPTAMLSAAFLQNLSATNATTTNTNTTTAAAAVPKVVSIPPPLNPRPATTTHCVTQDIATSRITAEVTPPHAATTFHIEAEPTLKVRISTKRGAEDEGKRTLSGLGLTEFTVPRERIAGVSVDDAGVLMLQFE